MGCDLQETTAQSGAGQKKTHGQHPEQPGHTPGGHERPRSPLPGMDPAVPKATLKVLGLSVGLLVLVAAVTVSVAVLLWRSEALGMLRGCRERAANESRVLELRLAELEQDRARLQRAVAESARAEDVRRRELAQARQEGKKLNSSLASCRERAVGAAGMGNWGGPRPLRPCCGVACMRGEQRCPGRLGRWLLARRNGQNHFDAPSPGGFGAGSWKIPAAVGVWKAPLWFLVPGWGAAILSSSQTEALHTYN